MEGLSSICAGLGILEEEDNGNPISYSKGEYCLDNLKDLLRFLRRDDPQTREVFKQICKWNIVGKDLIPIIEYCQDDRNLVLNAVKILVFLTMPIEPTSDDISLQIEYLWGLKSSVTSSHIVPVILSLLETPLEHLECESFTEDDWKLVQLVLTLFRNILAIQEISTQQKAGGSATQFLYIRDRCLELLFQENVMDLILVLTQHVGGSFGYLRQDNLLLLETFYYIFMGQEPELIAKAQLHNIEEAEKATIPVNSLKSIMEEEERRKLTRLRNLGCSPQFSGTFTRITLDGSKSLFKGNPCSASRDALLKSNKSHRGPSKRMVWDHGILPLTNNKLLKRLYDFIDQFLSGGYNVLMQSIREDIDKEHHAVQNNDVVFFFKVAWFITAFQYHKFSSSKPTTEAVNETSNNQPTDSMLFAGSLCGPLSESLNESMFILVISRWRLAFDSLKETNDTPFLSAAGSLLKIMIYMLDLVLKQSHEESMEPQTARVLLYKLFYDQTEEGMTHFLFNMIKSFDTHKQARSDLADLVEIIFVIIKLMENLQTRGTLRVSKRSRTKKMRKDRIDKLVGNDVTNQNEVPRTDYKPSEDAITPGETNPEDLDSRGKENEKAYPVNEPVQEMEKLKSNESEIENRISDDIHGTDDSSGDEQQVMIDEVDFKISTLVSALGNYTIVKKLCWLLRFYKSNSPSTNNCIIFILRRISEDLELSPLMYQLSLLTIFYEILEEQKSSPCKDYENVVLFLTTLVRRMLRRLKSCPLLFVEILFWKTRKECHYINSDCLLKELGGFRKEFNENQNDIINEETGLSEGRQWVQRSLADALGDDEGDNIVSHVEVDRRDEDPNKTEKVKERSKWKSDNEEESNESSPDDMEDNDSKEGECNEKVPEGLNKRRKSIILTAELGGKIKDLYKKYNSDKHCQHLIANALERDGDRISSNQLSRTLKQFGFKPPRKRTSQVGSTDQIRDSEVTLPIMDNLEGSSASRKPLHTRKRVRALTEDQEQRVKELFEQFKDQKRCSLMIANALEGGVSAAQVSRKLKQLGLSVPRKKRSETSFKLRDDGPNELSGGRAAAVSDDETLISLKRRREKRDPSETKDARNEVRSNDHITISSELADVDIPVLDRNGTERSAEVGIQEVGSTDFAETEAIGEQFNIASVEKNQTIHDELADFEDETFESQISFVPRRQFRMIMDLEDDE